MQLSRMWENVKINTTTPTVGEPRLETSRESGGIDSPRRHPKVGLMRDGGASVCVHGTQVRCPDRRPTHKVAAMSGDT